jgi:hypothetical protein
LAEVLSVWAEVLSVWAEDLVGSVPLGVVWAVSEDSVAPVESLVDVLVVFLWVVQLELFLRLVPRTSLVESLLEDLVEVSLARADSVEVSLV